MDLISIDTARTVVATPRTVTVTVPLAGTRMPKLWDPFDVRTRPLSSGRPPSTALSLLSLPCGWARTPPLRLLTSHLSAGHS